MSVLLSVPPVARRCLSLSLVARAFASTASSVAAYPHDTPSLTLAQVRAAIAALPVQPTARPPLLYREVDIDERLPFILNSTEPHIQAAFATPAGTPTAATTALTTARTVWEGTGYNFFVLFGHFGTVKMRAPLVCTFNPFSQRLELSPHPSMHALQPRARMRKHQEALLGTLATKLENNINGCMFRYKRLLKLVGMGYRIASVNPHPTHPDQRVVEFQLGRSHLLPFALPSSVAIKVLTKRGTVFRLLSTDLEAMQRVAMGIRQLKPPEAYTGKGVVFWGETVRRKEGKKK
jgi:large subunit ribosomal protein L6